MGKDTSKSAREKKAADSDILYYYKWVTCSAVNSNWKLDVAMTMLCSSRCKYSTNQHSTFLSMYNGIWQPNEPMFPGDVVSSSVRLQWTVKPKNRLTWSLRAIGTNTDHLALYMLLAPRTLVWNAMEIAFIMNILPSTQKSFSEAS